MKKFFFLCICSLLLVSCGKEKKFDLLYSEAVDAAFLTAAASERVCNQTKSAWSTAIYDRRDPNGHYCSDFNVALSVLYKKLEDDGSYSQINEIMEKMNTIAKELSDCPDSRKDAYNELVDFITDVNAFAKLAIYPSGSLQSYSNEVRSIDSRIAKQYDSFKIKYNYIFENGRR